MCSLSGCFFRGKCRLTLMCAVRKPDNRSQRENNYEHIILKYSKLLTEPCLVIKKEAHYIILFITKQKLC